MKHKLTRNLGLKILSLVVAFLIWLVVVNIDNPTNSKLYKDIKIQIVNEDSVTEIDKVFDLVSDDTVVVKVTERRSILDSLRAADFTVVADMENLNEMNSVPLTVTCSNPLVTLDEMQIVPSSMKVKLEQKTQSDFVINVSTIGDPKNGYEVGKTEVVQGKTVQIAGAESLLNKIDKVVARVKISGISTDQRRESTLVIYDKNGETFTEAQMARIQIKDSSGVLLDNNEVLVDITLWEVMSGIPVQVETIGAPAEGYRLSGVTALPVTVDLVGTPEALAALNGKIVLKDAVSVEGATESFVQEMDITETLSEIEDIRLVEDADPTIATSVQIEKIGAQTLQIPLSNIEVLNKPDNMTLTFSPADQISASIYSEKELGRIELSDIKVRVDLAVCAEEGDYEIPVEFDLPEGYELVSEIKLTVNARKPVQNENAAENTEE